MKIEDILKIKRAERPSEADWRKFDEQLKRKMLLSIVKKEPFYKRAAARLGIFSKPATAGLAALPLLAAAFLLAYGTPAGRTAPSKSAPEVAVTMPAAAHYFAVNEMSQTSAERALSAPLNFSDNSRINYASNSISATPSISF